ncbi:MAG: exodeoxyribonuclease VII small subunit [Atopobiaceae bacterium]|nr:exodeoxyribonuclease VII small subunit [Atopobiaceae bacterium]
MQAQQERKNIDEMTFREASTELEQIVRLLEAGDLELEEALSEYGRGVDLLKSLRQRLAEAEQRVRVLLDASQEVTIGDTTAAPSSAYLDE